MDFQSIFRAVGDRVTDWLARNGIEVHYEIHAGDMRIQGGVNRDGNHQRMENEDIGNPENGARTLVRLGAAIGSAVIVGTAVAAAGVVLAAPELLRRSTQGPDRGVAHSAGFLESRCAVVECLKDETETCTVCMESFKKGEELMILPCMHRYHKNCIMPWLQQSGLCSVCRYNVAIHD